MSNIADGSKGSQARTVEEIDKEYFEDLGITPVTLNVAKEIAKLNLETGEPTFLIGRAGIGKTALQHQIQEEMSALTGEKWGLQTQHLMHLQREDLTGFPFPDKDRPNEVRMLHIPNLPVEGECETRGILFLDEVNRAEQDVISPAFTLLEDRMLPGYKLPDGWGIIMAGNPANADYSVNEIERDPAIRRRMCILGVLCSVREWLIYAEKEKYHPTVIAYIHLKMSTGLYDIEAQTSGKIAATPATWEKVSRTLYHIEEKGIDPMSIRGILTYKIAGNIGIQRAKDFMNLYLTHTVEVDPADIISGFMPGSAIYKTVSDLFTTGIGSGGRIATLANKVAERLSIDMPPPVTVAPFIAEFLHFLVEFQADTSESFRIALVSHMGTIGDGDKYRSNFSTALIQEPRYREACDKLVARLKDIKDLADGINIESDVEVSPAIIETPIST